MTKTIFTFLFVCCAAIGLAQDDARTKKSSGGRSKRDTSDVVQTGPRTASSGSRTNAARIAQDSTATTSDPSMRNKKQEVKDRSKGKSQTRQR